MINWLFMNVEDIFVLTSRVIINYIHIVQHVRKEIWDGKDMEREPEGINNSEDIASSVVTIGGGR